MAHSVTAGRAEGHPGLGQGGIHRSTGGQGGVEGARQLDGAGVADLGLHGHGRGHALLHQRLGHAGKDRLPGGQRALAGVEVGQAHGGMVAQQRGQLLALHQLCPAACVLQRQAAGLAAFVEDAVADEMQDVYRLAQQPLLQGAEAGRGQPFQHELAVGHQPGQRVLDRLPLPLHVQRRQAGGAGEHGQHPQGRLHQQGRARAGQGEVAQDGRLLAQADEVGLGRVVEGLPGQGGQLRGVLLEAQAQAQPVRPPGPRCSGWRPAASVPCPGRWPAKRRLPRSVRLVTEPGSSAAPIWRLTPRTTPEPPSRGISSGVKGRSKTTLASPSGASTTKAR